MRWSARLRRWNAHRPWLRWCAVGAVALLVAVTVAQRVGDLDERRAAWGAVQSVVVARRTLAPGEAVTSTDVVVDERPSALLPDTSLLQPGDLPAGARTWQWVVAGEALTLHDLTGVSSPATQMPPRTRGVVVPAGGLPARPGDPVDVSVDGVSAMRATVIDTMPGRSGVHGDALLVAVPEHRAAAVAWAVADGRVAVMLAGRPSAVSANPSP